MSKEQKDKSPAYQWYPRKVFGSQRVSLMSLAEEGAYRRALDYCWLHGSIPADPKKLAFLIGKGCTEKIAKGILGMFMVHPTDQTLLIHETIEREREKQKAFSEKQSENGSKGGRPPKNKSQNKPKPFEKETQNDTETDSQKKLCSLEFGTEVNTPPNPQGGIEGGEEKKFEIESEIMKHFGLTETNNFKQMVMIHEFCVTLNHRKRLDYFTEQFTAYRKFKELNKDRKGWYQNLGKFLGTGKEFFEDGNWTAEVWTQSLADFRKSNGTVATAGGKAWTPRD